MASPVTRLRGFLSLRPNLILTEVADSMEIVAQIAPFPVSRRQMAIFLARIYRTLTTSA